MKVTPLLAAAAAVFAFSMPAGAAVDADAANKMLKDNGCTKCHSVDKDKKGPSFKKTAAKYKGKADAEAKLTDVPHHRPQGQDGRRHPGRAQGRSRPRTPPRSRTWSSSSWRSKHPRT